MRQSAWLFCLLTVSACVRELPIDASDAASPGASSEAVEAGSGVLDASFDADSIAPVAVDSASHDHHHHDSAADAEPTSFTCPHHPEVVSDKPGKCPKCGMSLVPKRPAAKPAKAGESQEGH